MPLAAVDAVTKVPTALRPMITANVERLRAPAPYSEKRTRGYDEKPASDTQFALSSEIA